MGRKTIEILEHNNSRGRCTFCMSEKVRYKLHYSDDGHFGRSVSMPLCKGCHKKLIRAALAEKAESIEALVDEIQEERGENFRKARMAALELLSMLEE